MVFSEDAIFISKSDLSGPVSLDSFSGFGGLL